VTVRAPFSPPVSPCQASIRLRSLPRPQSTYENVRELSTTGAACPSARVVGCDVFPHLSGSTRLGWAPREGKYARRIIKNLRRDKHPLMRCLRRSMMVALLSVRLEMVIMSKARVRGKQINMIPNLLAPKNGACPARADTPVEDARFRRCFRSCDPHEYRPRGFVTGVRASLPPLARWESTEPR